VAGVLSLDDACRLVAAWARLMAELPPGGAMAVVLRVSHGSHSTLVDPMLPAYAEVAATVEHRPPTTPLVSMLTGAAVADVTAQHWIDQTHHTVRYADDVQALSDVTVLELGAGRLAEVTVAICAKNRRKRRQPCFGP